MKEILPISVFTRQFTATATPAEISLGKYFVSPGKRGVMATLSVINATGAATDTGTLAVKLQSSATTVDTDFADITSGAFTTVADTDVTTSAGSLEALYFGLPAESNYVRAVATVTGNPVLDAACDIFMLKRSA